jgi:hypothetical protein
MLAEQQPQHPAATQAGNTTQTLLRNDAIGTAQAIATAAADSDVQSVPAVPRSRARGVAAAHACRVHPPLCACFLSCRCLCVRAVLRPMQAAFYATHTTARHPTVCLLHLKQGSVLSPLLFGLFIEVLHELVRQHAGAVGPVLAGLRVPLVIYADDVLLLAESEADAQALLDVLALFCRLFGMRVNLAPRKTCAVVFRPAGQAPPAVTLCFRARACLCRTNTHTWGWRSTPLAGCGGRLTTWPRLAPVLCMPCWVACAHALICPAL